MTRYRLDKNDVKYLDSLWRRCRRATLKMIDAHTELDKQSDALNRWLDSMGRFDPIDRAQVRADNIALKDAFGEWQLWHGSVIALNGAIQAEMTARQLLGLEDERYVEPEPSKDDST